MLIPEAAQLVIQAGAMSHNGQVFVLDMGEPVKIVDLAKRMIHLMGMKEFCDGRSDEGDIEIKFTACAQEKSSMKSYLSERMWKALAIKRS